MLNYNIVTICIYLSSCNTTASHFIFKNELVNAGLLFSEVNCETSSILEHSSAGISFDVREDSYVQILTEILGQ